MSRLVINKTEERVICIIKNFGSLELSDNTVKVIDKYGLKEFNIFLLSNGLVFKNFYIHASNAYSIFSNKNDHQWYVHSAVAGQLYKLVNEFYYKRLGYAIQSKVLNFDEFTFKFADQLLTIDFQEYSITDNFKIIHPSNYNNAEFAILGEKYMLHITQGGSLQELENVYESSLCFPYALYNMYMYQSQISVLRNFIGACLNSLQREDEFLSVRKLS